MYTSNAWFAGSLSLILTLPSFAAEITNNESPALPFDPSSRIHTFYKTNGSPAYAKKRSLPDIETPDTSAKATEMGYLITPKEVELQPTSLGPTWRKPSLKMTLWCDDCKSKVVKAWSSSTGEPLDKPISCTFLVDSDGSIRDPFVYSGMCSEATGQQFIHILQSAAPFKAPPIELAQQRVLATFLQNSNCEIGLDIKSYTYCPEPDKFFQQIKKKPLNSRVWLQ